MTTTPPTAEAVKEAAERVKEHYANWMEESHADELLVARFALEVLRGDGEEFPDLDWLKSEYGAWRHMQPASSYNHTIGDTVGDDINICFWFDFDRSKIRWSVNIDGRGRFIPNITTRRQFRQLAAALNIHPTPASDGGNQKGA